MEFGKVCVLACVVFGFLNDVYAYDGVVTINGQITGGGTCTINVTPGSGSTLAVVLPTVSMNSLSKGSHAGSTPFAIELSQCSYAASTVSANFYSGNVDVVTGYLINTATDSSAHNVELELLDYDAVTPLIVGVGGSGASPSVSAQFVGGVATLHYYVRYVAPAAAASPGVVQAAATYTMNYM